MAVRVHWLGHATVLIEMDGARLLTDPMLRGGPWPFVRRRAPGRVDLEAVRDLDAVLISHAHQDHMHPASLRLLPPDTRLVVPRGARRWLERRGFGHVEEVAAGDSIEVGAVRVRATPAAHQGYRIPFGPRADALGFVVEGSARVYFAGDTDVFEAMAEIPASLDGPLDLALLPVGGWGLTLRGGHMDPERAAHALRLLRPRETVPIHWGTYWPVGLSRVRSARFHGPGEAFRRAAAALAPNVRVHVLAPGEELTLAAT